jgi:hypothetical protein
MLAKLTLLASTSYPQIGGLDYSLTAETAYIFNLKHLISAVVHSSDDTEFEYVFEPDSRQSSYAIFRVSETLASIATLAETSPDETLIPLTVLTDYDGDVLDTAVTRYFNIDQIILCDEYDTDKTALYVSISGVSVKQYTVQESLDEIIALVTA